MAGGLAAVRGGKDGSNGDGVISRRAGPKEPAIGQRR